MKSFKRGQIWLVNFDPSFGREYQKVRPALIVQNDEYIDASSLLTVIPISSQTTKQTPLDILLKKDATNRLAKDSLVKIKQISSFDKRRFIKFVGIVHTETMQSIVEHLRLHLQL
ncbi:MAG: type II toxin-antitoxin system PemK/MazF family toxin [bacterium]